MKNNFLINGNPRESISPFDRGLSFGDGVFRTFLVKNGCPINWDMHYEKLKLDGKIFKIKVPTKKDLLRDIKKLFIQDKTYIGKIIITRGISDQGYYYSKNIKSTRIVLKINYKKISRAFYLKGVKLKVCNTRITHNDFYGGVKHLNRIENVIAKSELTPSVFDGLMLDRNGYINECVSSNIFARYGNVLITPKQNNGGVSGVCKQIIFKNIKSLGLKFKSQNIKLEKLKRADEVIITNSVFGALYVNQIEEKKWQDGLFTPLIKNFIINPDVK
ncbi:aminodeoxychorismate lyase [Methylophilaceae bacterium]|nr:aminodeoxychorismate lyase [Methylophilaceae bacterium]